MDKNLPEKYLDIKPTILEVDEANRLVDEVLDLAESGKYDSLQVAETFVELLGRLSDRYVGFSPDAAIRVFAWCKNNFDLNNLSLIDANLSIMMNVPSLKEAKEFVQLKLTEAEDPTAKELLVDFCREAVESLAVESKSNKG